jgi:nucleoside-diphosphate-sugar epimerase
MKRAVVFGGAGMLGLHLCARLQAEGRWVIVVGRSHPRYDWQPWDEFHYRNLADNEPPLHLCSQVDEVYQLAGEVGGLGYIQDANNDATILRNAMRINLNILDACRASPKKPNIFFASSACVYPDTFFHPSELEFDTLDHGYLLGKTSDGATPESAAYPAHPTNEFGWEKLFAERLYDAYARNYGMNIHIARLGNTYGTHCTWNGPRAKAPAAICRKVAAAGYAEPIEVWGDGTQTRSFMHVDDAVEGIMRLMSSDVRGPVNLGSSELVSVDQLITAVQDAAGRITGVQYVPGPLGVRGRVSDNTLLREKLGWEPQIPLRDGIAELYEWVAKQVEKNRAIKMA